MKTITQSRLKEVLTYDPAGGFFYWAVDRKKCSKGAVAGSVRPDGYVAIRVDYHRYYANRLAWLYMTGEWPALDVDHADGNASNNAWGNLREASPTQSMQNRPAQRNNRQGLKGVRKSGRKFYASIQIDGVSKYLGTFEDAGAAHAAYCQASKAAFGDFARFA